MNPDAKKKIFNGLKLIVKILIALGSLYYVYSKINVQSLVQYFKTANIGYLILALLFFAYSKYISSKRLNVFFSQLNIILTNVQNLKLYLLGMFYNFFLPGGIGGDGYKIYLLNKQYPGNAKKLFWAVLLDRVTGVVALFCLAVIMIVFISHPSGFKYFIWILAPIVLIIIYLIIRYFFSYFTNVFVKTTISSFLVQIAQVVSAFMILLALNIHNFTMEYLVVFLLSSIVAALPISIGGIGSREIAFLFGAQYLSLNVNAAVALSVLFYLITAIVSFFGIYFSFNTEKLVFLKG